MGNKRKRKCHNCKHAGQQFKIDKLTHLHCENPKDYTKEKFESGELSAWDTLRVFSDDCKDHEFKQTDKFYGSMWHNEFPNPNVL